MKTGLLHMRSTILRMLTLVWLSTLPLSFSWTFADTERPCPHELRSEKSPGNIIRMGTPASSINTLDPHLAIADEERIIADMVFNGLLRYVPGLAPSIEADLAESIPVPVMKKRRQIWTIHLRRGVMFHACPGMESYELTADDVVFSLQRSADANRSIYANEYEGMSFRKIDAYTVEIICETPYTSNIFLTTLCNYAGGFIVSKKACETLGESFFQKHPVGTGPFRFDHYKDQKHVALFSHETYFRGRPLLDGVEMVLNPDILMLEHELRCGKIEIIRGLGEKKWIRSMRKSRDLTVDIHGMGNSLVFHFNIRKPPLDNLLVRQAIAYALDRETFTRAIGKAVAEPIFSPIPAQTIPRGMSRDEVNRIGLLYSHDLGKARDLMDKAGYAEGFDLDLFSSRLHYAGYLSFKEQLNEIGIDCSIQIIDNSLAYKKLRRESSPVVLSFAFRPSANSYLSEFFHSRSIDVDTKTGGRNFSRYKNVDRLIDAARAQTDPEMQEELWKHAQIRILDDMAAYPACLVKIVYVRNKNLDYGHPLINTLAMYPQFTEKTRKTAPAEQAKP